MKLCDVPKRSRIRLRNLELEFYYIDGVYAHCKVDGKLIYPAAWTEVELLGPMLKEVKDEIY